MRLGNILKDFKSIDMKKTGLNGCVHEFSFDYNIINTSNIIEIHKYLIKKHDIKIMLKKLMLRKLCVSVTQLPKLELILPQITLRTATVLETKTKP